MKTRVQQTVEQYYHAWRTGQPEQFPFSDDFTFDGPMLSFSNPADFRKMASEFSPMVQDIKLLDSSYQENKGFVMLEFATNIPQIGGWIALDYFVVEGDKIKYSRTAYDPHKLIEFMQSR